MQEHETSTKSECKQGNCKNAFIQESNQADKQNRKKRAKRDKQGSYFVKGTLASAEARKKQRKRKNEIEKKSRTTKITIHLGKYWQMDKQVTNNSRKEIAKILAAKH